MEVIQNLLHICTKFQNVLNAMRTTQMLWNDFKSWFSVQK